MIFEVVLKALADLLSPALRIILAKTLGATLLALVALWFALKWLFDATAMPWLAGWFAALPRAADWLGPLADIAVGLGLAFALGLLIAPATALMAGLFLDEAAEAIERRDYPSDHVGRPMPAVASLLMSVRFFGVVLLGNVVALLLLLVPGVNIAAFFLVNAYLLGREYFEFAAMRFRGELGAKALRRRHRGLVFLAGLAIAGFVWVPLLNLATPLFACALMVHLNKMIERREARSAS